MEYKKSTAIKELIAILLNKDLSLTDLLEIRDAAIAKMWSAETDTILRAASGLLREIYRRDRYQWETPERRPWEYLLSFDPGVCE